MSANAGKRLGQIDLENEIVFAARYFDFNGARRYGLSAQFDEVFVGGELPLSDAFDPVARAQFDRQLGERAARSDGSDYPGNAVVDVDAAEQRPDVWLNQRLGETFAGARPEQRGLRIGRAPDGRRGYAWSSSRWRSPETAGGATS